MPTHDEHGVRDGHQSSITYFRTVCPVEVSHVRVNHGQARVYSGSGPLPL